jgi:cell division protein FtsB
MNNNKVPTCKHKGEEPDCLELRGRGRSWTEIEKLRRERNMTKLERTARAAVIPTVIATVIAAVVAAVVIATEVSSKKRIEKEASDFSRLSASELVFPKDVKFLTDEAARFNLEFEAIDDEEKFKSLQEKVRKNLIVETLEPYKIAGFLRKLDRVEWTEEAL